MTKSDVFKVYGAALDSALNYKANCFSSVILWNEDGKLVPHKLPYQAQLAPMQGFAVMDVDGDTDLDILGAGNWFMSEVETPRADSGTGLVLINKGGKNFESSSVEAAGFFANLDVRNIVNVASSSGQQLVVANNNADLQLFRLNKK